MRHRGNNLLDKTIAVSAPTDDGLKHTKPVHFGLLTKLGLSVLVAGLFIATNLDLFGKDRVSHADLEESRAMVQSATLTFAQGLNHHGEVLLDALVHELQSRRNLHIQKAYVLDMSGRVLARSNTVKYGKQDPLVTATRHVSTWAVHTRGQHEPNDFPGSSADQAWYA